MQSDFNDDRNNTPYTTTTGLIRGNPSYLRQRSKNTNNIFLSQDLTISDDDEEDDLNRNMDTNTRFDPNAFSQENF